MCQAHVLRFSCGHGILMHVDTCSLGPCPCIKTTASRLPQQPHRCYKCQERRATTFGNSSAGDYKYSNAAGYPASSNTSTSSLLKVRSAPSAPLPNFARQLNPSVLHPAKRPRLVPVKSFTFSCTTSDHYATPHYTSLPEHLPHQSHPCPQCELSNLRLQSDREATAKAMDEFPYLRAEMLVRNGREREDWESSMTLEKYVEERRAEEKQMWLFVCKKWMQDLKKARVLVAQEDGLGLLG